MTPPPPRARETDRPEASAKPKRAWSKPVIKKMSYLNVVASGPHITGNDEKIKYRPSS